MMSEDQIGQERLVPELAVNKLAYRVFGGEGEDNNVGFRVCNISSFCFYMIQAIYSTYILIRLSRKTEKKTKRSCSLIVAVAMILYSSIALAFLFGDS